MRRIFDCQFETALRLRTSTAAERIEKIKRLKAAVLAHAEEIYAAGEADYRKPPAEMDLTELLPVVAEANDAIRHLRGWMKPRRVWPTRTTLMVSAHVQYQPRGRCLLISPWNYPVNLSFGPLVSAIAAGNTVIIKPSEMTPHLSAVIVKITREVFSEDEVAIFEGDASVAHALLDLPFDHIFFTGSPAVGKIVMAAAAKHLASVTLELGGKSPTIIDETANLRLAAQVTMWGKFTNNGQTCIAPDHVFVHESVREQFVGLCREVIAHAYGGDAQAQKQSPYLARVVNVRHTSRIKSLLDDARARGARASTGGVVDESDRYIAPTLLEAVPDDARIMQEEIFGPVLPIIPFRELGQVIRRINLDPKPLALYIWSRNRANVERVMQQTTSGGACVNDSVAQFVHGNLPFGGVNNSGIGNAHGHWGFKAFSHERAVIHTFMVATKMLFPPFTDRVRSLIRMLLRIV